MKIYDKKSIKLFNKSYTNKYYNNVIFKIGFIEIHLFNNFKIVIINLIIKTMIHSVILFMSTSVLKSQV
jgi:hypothetical protein